MHGASVFQKTLLTIPVSTQERTLHIVCLLIAQVAGWGMLAACCACAIHPDTSMQTICLDIQDLQRSAEKGTSAPGCSGHCRCARP